MTRPTPLEQEVGEILKPALKMAYEYGRRDGQGDLQRFAKPAQTQLLTKIQEYERNGRVDELETLLKKHKRPTIQPLTISFYINDRLAELKGDK